MALDQNLYKFFYIFKDSKYQCKSQGTLGHVQKKNFQTCRLFTKLKPTKTNPLQNRTGQKQPLYFIYIFEALKG